MQLTFLGTSSGTPTRRRNVTSLAVTKDDGDVWLVDCGEATQHQILRSSIKPGRIARVLISHLHGDHLYGLPGLLASLGIHGRVAPVAVVGPRGIADYLRGVATASSTTLPFEVNVTELDAERDLGTCDGLGLSAHPIVHRIPCFGYVLRAPERRGKLDALAAQRAGVVDGPLLGRLARGEDVRSPNGALVTAAEVLGPTRPGAHLVVLGDTSNPLAIAEAARGCDAIVHEATYADDLAGKALEWGHSTAAMAARFAAKVNARTLVLTHFSARYDEGPTGTLALLDEAQKTSPGLHVLLAEDFLTLTLTPGEGAAP